MHPVKQMTWGVALALAASGASAAQSFAWITPSVHLNAAVGRSSSDQVAELAVGHHDPTRESGTLQGLELGASLRLNDYVHGFAAYALHYGAEEKWKGEQEEAFIKLVRLPGGFELRGGRMLARFGAQNAVHPHGWDFVDAPLAAGLLIGEHGLILDGGDMTWGRRFHEVTAGLVAGYGKAVAHDHQDDHLDDEEDGLHGHPSGGWEDEVAYARVFAMYQPDDFNRWLAGFSGAFGDNADHRDRAVYGADITYRWRENGLAPGGYALRWTTEGLIRREPRGGDHDGDLRPDGERLFGFYSQTVWTWNDNLETGLRIGYVEGEAARPARWRASPALTYRPFGTQAVALRLQYNYDDLKTAEEHSVWLQLGLAWGGAEAR